MPLLKLQNKFAKLLLTMTVVSFKADEITYYLYGVHDFNSRESFFQLEETDAREDIH
jgi:hypothetical protein